ncbi:unnamed protein product [Adineta steineri]|uniref:MULE transposase domain-containing protein n=1 Tax=Adineta steineri TaxID=433720 RepID=A0A815B3X1_9BILA|nr:unnamed protein product [Adineta steineri]CAF4212005.1 unnamed protein product [Adineta steineri]
MSIIKSSKNCDQLLFDGYRYRRDKLAWRCVTNGCKGRASYDKGIYTTYQNHICRAPDPDEIEKVLYNYEIKKNAQQSHDPPRLIIQNARLKISLDAAINIPQYIASQRSIQRVRRDKDIPTEPKTFADIIIPLNYQVNSLNEQFLLYDNNDNQRRILIFASKQHLDFLNECESWHCDGTFAVAPTLFEQMYSIHGSIRGKKLPLLYSLLPNKDQKTYEELFGIVAQHVQRKPNYITIDFEKAAENAFNVIYPQCEILGCFFHFKKCIWKHICELHLKNEFLENQNNRRTMKNLTALAFVPPNNVIEEFARIKENASDILDDLILYFEDNFIGRIMTRNRRKNPRYNINMWNCFERINEDLPRTNNAIEGWHNAFHNVVGDHPSLFTFIKDIVREEKNTTIVWNQVLAGTQSQTKRTKYDKIDLRIRNMVKEFHTVSRNDYFKMARSVFNF